MPQDEEFPLYPTLSEEGKAEAIALVEAFKDQMADAAEKTIRALYCDLTPHIESDAWSNMRTDLMDGLKDYANRSSNQFDFKEIRQSILKNHRAEIIDDLNQDLVEENEKMKADIERLREDLRRSYG